MMKSMFAFCLLVTFTGSYGQFLQDITGQPYLQKTSAEYQGSPFLFPNWVKANITVSSGKTYQNILLNIDLIQRTPVFINGDKVLTFSEKLNELILADSTTKTKFKRGTLISASLPDELLEVVNETPLLLKKYERDIVEVPTYGSSTKSYRYAEGKTYYTFLDNEYKKISLSKENAKKMFFKHWNETERFAKSNDISYKSDDGWRRLFQYYHELSR